MSNLEQILKATAEWREKREDATQGEWVSRVTEKQIYPGRFVLYATNKPTFIDDPWHWTEKKRPEIKSVCNDADFIAHAANNSDKLVQAIEVMAKALQQYVDNNEPSAPGDYFSADGGSIASDALEKAAQILTDEKKV